MDALQVDNAGSVPNNGNLYNSKHSLSLWDEGTLEAEQRGIADSALAEPSGAGRDTWARYPQSGDFIANVPARQDEGIRIN